VTSRKCKSSKSQNLTAKARRREDHFALVANWAPVLDPAPKPKDFSSRLRDFAVRFLEVELSSRAG
jgi:hypothetical protein